MCAPTCMFTRNSGASPLSANNKDFSRGIYVLGQRGGCCFCVFTYVGAAACLSLENVELAPCARLLWYSNGREWSGWAGPKSNECSVIEPRTGTEGFNIFVRLLRFHEAVEALVLGRSLELLIANQSTLIRNYLKISPPCCSPRQGGTALPSALLARMGALQGYRRNVLLLLPKSFQVCQESPLVSG
jgi:hypothetical protein